MKLYVCYGTWKPAPRPGGHPCGRAYHARQDAGHSPEVIKSYGLGVLPDALNQTPGRKEVQRLTGTQWGPAGGTDVGSGVKGRSEFEACSPANPAEAAAASAFGEQN